MSWRIWYCRRAIERGQDPWLAFNPKTKQGWWLTGGRVGKDYKEFIKSHDVLSAWRYDGSNYTVPFSTKLIHWLYGGE